MLLEDSRTILSLLDHGLCRTRQEAGLGRPQLRFVIPTYLPESLAVEATSRLRSVADAAGVGITWMETALDAGFSPIRQRRADAGLGWLTAPGQELPGSLEVMSLGNFEPEVWLHDAHPAALRGVIGLDELSGMDVVHGPRRLGAGIYDAWLAVLRAASPRSDFIDPPFCRSLPVTLAFAATASRPTAVVTGPQHRIEDWPWPARPGPDPAGMVRARADRSPFAATAALVWTGDLPRQLQQVLFDTADGIAI